MQIFVAGEEGRAGRSGGGGQDIGSQAFANDDPAPSAQVADTFFYGHFWSGDWLELAKELVGGKIK